MERRNFLQGLLVSASAAAGTALVKLATPEEAKALTVAAPTVIGQPQLMDQLPFPPIHGSEFVYAKNADGRFVAIGIVTEIRWWGQSALDGTRAWDGTVTLVPGLGHGQLKFQGRLQS